MTKERKQRAVNFRTEPSLWDDVRCRAVREHRPVARVIRALLKYYVEKGLPGKEDQ